MNDIRDHKVDADEEYFFIDDMEIGQSIELLIIISRWQKPLSLY